MEPQLPATAEESEALAQDLLTRLDLMFSAMSEFGVSPFADAKNFLALQLAGPALLAIQGINPTEGIERVAAIVQSMDLAPLIAKWGPQETTT
jgi:hypothetical protein